MPVNRGIVKKTEGEKGLLRHSLAHDPDRRAAPLPQAGSGCGAQVSLFARIQRANCTLEAGPHLFFFGFWQPAAIEAQHVVPELDLGLEQVAL